MKKFKSGLKLLKRTKAERVARFVWAPDDIRPAGVPKPEEAK